MGPLVMVPILVSRFGLERYGLWATASALVSAAVFADFGLGSGLLTRLTVAVSQGRTQESRDLVQTALLLVASTAAVLALVAGLILALSGTPVPGDEADLQKTLIIIGGAFLVNLPLSLVHRVELAYQSIVASNVWQALGSIFSVSFGLMAVALGASFLVVVAASVAGLPMANALNWAWFTLIRRPEAALWRGRPRASLAPAIYSLGLPFLLLNGLIALAANGDLLIVGWADGYSASGLLSIALRYMAVVNILVAAVAMAFWPSAGDAFARGDSEWVAAMTRRTARYSGVAALAVGGILVAVSAATLPLWLGDGEVAPGTGLLLSCVAWFTVQAYVAPYLAAMSASAFVWGQVLAYALYLILATLIKLMIIDDAGLIGVMSVSWLLYAVVFALLIQRWKRAVGSGPRSSTWVPKTSLAESSQPSS